MSSPSVVVISDDDVASVEELQGPPGHNTFEAGTGAGPSAGQTSAAALNAGCASTAVFATAQGAKTAQSAQLPIAASERAAPSVATSEAPTAAAYVGAVTAAEETCCCICLEPLAESGSHKAATLKCGHIFGKQCLEEWFKRNGTKTMCPQCKRKCNKKDMVELYNLPRVVAGNPERLEQAEQEIKRLKRMLKEKEVGSGAAPSGQQPAPLTGQPSMQQHAAPGPSGQGMRPPWWPPPVLPPELVGLLLRRAGLGASGPSPGFQLLQPTAPLPAAPTPQWGSQPVAQLAQALTHGSVAGLQAPPHGAAQGAAAVGGYGPHPGAPPLQPPHHLAAAAGRIQPAGTQQQQPMPTGHRAAPQGPPLYLQPGMQPHNAGPLGQSLGAIVGQHTCAGHMPPSNHPSNLAAAGAMAVAPAAAAAATSSGAGQPTASAMPLTCHQRWEATPYSAPSQQPLFTQVQNYVTDGSRCCALHLPASLLLIAEQSEQRSWLRRVSILQPECCSRIELPSSTDCVKDIQLSGTSPIVVACNAAVPAAAASGSGGPPKYAAVATTGAGLLLLSTASANIVARYPTAAKAWSCCWVPGNEALLWAGLGNGRLALIDTRKASDSVCVVDLALPQPLPVHSVIALPPGTPVPAMPGAAQGHGQGLRERQQELEAAGGSHNGDGGHHCLVATLAGMFSVRYSGSGSTADVVPVSVAVRERDGGSQCESIALAWRETASASASAEPGRLPGASLHAGVSWRANEAAMQAGLLACHRIGSLELPPSPSGVLSHPQFKPHMGLSGHRSCKRLTRGAFLPASDLFCSGDEATCAPLVWSLRSGAVMQRLDAHMSEVLQVFGSSHAGSQLLGCCSETRVCLYQSVGAQM